MASEVFMSLGESRRYLFDDGLECGCDINSSHYAIIAKGNIIEGIEAKE